MTKAVLSLNCRKIDTIQQSSEVIFFRLRVFRQITELILANGTNQRSATVQMSILCTC